MDDPTGVRGREATRDSERDGDGLVHRQRPRVETLAQALPFQAFGHEERRAAVLADVVDGEDVRVIERACRSRFVRKAAQALGIAREVRQQDLDRDVAVETFVSGAPHFARAAGPEQSNDGVRADRARPARRLHPSAADGSAPDRSSAGRRQKSARRHRRLPEGDSTSRRSVSSSPHARRRIRLAHRAGSSSRFGEDPLEPLPAFGAHRRHRQSALGTARRARTPSRCAPCAARRRASAPSPPSTSRRKSEARRPAPCAHLRPPASRAPRSTATRSGQARAPARSMPSSGTRTAPARRGGRRGAGVRCRRVRGASSAQTRRRSVGGSASAPDPSRAAEGRPR